MYVKVFVIVVKNIFIYCYIYIQTVELAFKNRFSFVNLSLFVREVVCICVWIFETPLTSANARMHFFFQMELSAANELSPSFSANHISLAPRGDGYAHYISTLPFAEGSEVSFKMASGSNSADSSVSKT